MEVFSELLLVIYRASREMDPADFQENVLTRIKSALAFDSCTWSTSIVTPEQGMVYLSAYLYEEMPGRLEDYAEIRLQDTVPQFAVEHPGVTVNVHAPTFFTGKERVGIRDYCAHYRHQNFLATGRPEQAKGIFHGFVLYRGDVHQHYSEEERRLCQCLVPHLMEALSNCYSSYLERLKMATEERIHCVALADSRGMVREAGPGFSILFLTEWPNWDGVRLPCQLLELPLSRGRASFVGSSLVVLLTRVKDLVFLQARPKMPIDYLTPRERGVAACVAEGLSYKEIARRLHIAPSTARNHIQSIHERLGIHSGPELVSLIRQCTF